MRFLTLLHLSAMLAAGKAAIPFDRAYQARDEPSVTCDTTTTLDPITVTGDGGGTYTQCYTVTYPGLGHQGSPTSIPYTITQTCSNPICRGAAETTPPPGFTCAIVDCGTCAPGGGSVHVTVTVPTSVIDGYISSGYTIQTPPPENLGTGGSSDGSPGGGDGSSSDSSSSDDNPSGGPAGDGSSSGDSQGSTPPVVTAGTSGHVSLIGESYLLAAMLLGAVIL
ncbi:uncharacterized protein E0L32_007545 [Thyridium curvatum]|uniref:Uncharacterized protein n=1 Tax=Thyridium curvatum TaxID=1093900 RepID=A0A507B4K9_9PEZI|nr:uncharacterized protein E0L32_007545 [Thyridium curvatum]TPX11808.1 hypothetical protein E0L32_007545 [Thyridium curvatum]